MEQNQDIVTSSFTIDFYDPVLSLWRTCEGIGLSAADSRESIERYLQRNPGTSYVALDKDRVVGAILAGHDGRRGYLHHLAVHPDYRHRGIGRLLLGKALDALREAGIDKCHGFVFRSNRNGIGFWQSVGWVPWEDVCLISKTIKSATEGE